MRRVSTFGVCVCVFFFLGGGEGRVLESLYRGLQGLEEGNTQLYLLTGSQGFCAGSCRALGGHDKDLQA